MVDALAPRVGEDGDLMRPELAAVVEDGVVTVGGVALALGLEVVPVYPTVEAVLADLGPVGPRESRPLREVPELGEIGEGSDGVLEC